MERIQRRLLSTAMQRQSFEGEGSFYCHPKAGDLGAKRCVMQKATVEVEDGVMSVTNQEYSVAQEMVPGLLFDVTPHMNLTVSPTSTDSDSAISIRFRQLQHSEILGDAQWLSIEFEEEETATKLLLALLAILAIPKRGSKVLSASDLSTLLTFALPPAAPKALSPRTRALLAATSPQLNSVKQAPAAALELSDSEEDEPKEMGRRVDCSALLPDLQDYSLANVLFVGKGLLQDRPGLLVLVKAPTASVDFVGNKKETVKTEITSHFRYEYDPETLTFHWHEGEALHSFSFECDPTHFLPLLRALLQQVALCASISRSIPNKVYADLVPRVVPVQRERKAGVSSTAARANSYELSEGCIRALEASHSLPRKLQLYTSSAIEILQLSPLLLQSSLRFAGTRCLLASSKSVCFLYSPQRSSVFVWSVERGEVVEEWRQPLPVTDLCEMQDSSLVAVGGSTVWRIDKGKAVHEHTFSSLPAFTSIHSCNLGFLASTQRSDIRFYNDTKRAKNVYQPHTSGRLVALDLSTDGRWVLVTYTDELELIDTVKNGKSAFISSRVAVTGWRFGLPAKARERLARATYTKATFDDRSEPTAVVTTLGNCVILWSFAALVDSAASRYRVRTTQVWEQPETLVTAVACGKRVVAASERCVTVLDGLDI